MLFGVTTMTFFHKPILEALEMISKCGFDCAEIWVDHAWDEEKGASAAEIKAVLAQHKLESTIHCSIMDISITSPNKGIREESLRQTFQAIDFARDLGSRLIVIHPGSRFSTLEDKKAHWNHQVNSIGQILAYAKKQGVIAAVENMDSDKEVVSVKDWDDLNRIFTELKSDEKWVTFDVTHVRDTEKCLEFIAKSGTNIAHLHLSDGTKNQMHMRIGEGELGLKEIVAALQKSNYAGVCSLECFIANNTEEKLLDELARAKALFMET